MIWNLWRAYYKNVRQATKIIHGLHDLSYKERLARVEISSLVNWRAREDMAEVFKYTHELYKVGSTLLQLDCETKKATHLSWRNKDATPICARTFFTHRVTDLLKRLPERELAASQSTLLETGCIMKNFYFLGIRQSFRFWITETTSGFSAGLAQWPVAWVFLKKVLFARSQMQRSAKDFKPEYSCYLFYSILFLF